MIARVAWQWAGLLLLLAAPALVASRDVEVTAATSVCDALPTVKNIDTKKKPVCNPATKKSGGYPVSTKCTFSCATGYTPKSKKTGIVSTCVKKAGKMSWDTPNSCTKITDAACTIDTSKFDEYTVWKLVKPMCSHGKTCTAECAEGTSPSGGLPGVSCTNGVAKKLAGKCVPDPCELDKQNPDLPRFATFSTASCGSGTIQHGTSCTANCLDGTDAGAGGAPKASCDLGKLTFSGSCTPSACMGPPAGSADFASCASGVSSGDTCTGTCTDGALGTLSSACQFGSWGAAVGECYGSGLTNACTDSSDPCSGIQDAVSGSCTALAGLKGAAKPAADSGFSCRCNQGYQFDPAAKKCVAVTAIITGYYKTAVKTKVTYEPFAFIWGDGMWNELSGIPKKIGRLFDVDIQSWPDSGFAYFSGINTAGSGTVISLANDGDNSNWALEFEDGNEECRGVSSAGTNSYAVCVGSGALKVGMDGLWEATAGDDEAYVHTDIKVKLSPNGNDAIVLRTTDATDIGLPEDSAVLGFLSMWDPDNSQWVPVASSDQSAFYAVSIYTETTTNDNGDTTTVFHAWIAGDDMTFKWNSVDETRLEVVPMDTYGIQFMGIAAVGPDLVWAVGSRGTIMVNTDGTTWQLQDSTVTVDLTNVVAVDSMTAMAVGEDLTVTPIVWDGLSWNQQAASSDGVGPNTVAIVSGIDMVASSAGASSGGGDVSPSPPPPDYYGYDDYEAPAPPQPNAVAASTGKRAVRRKHKARRPSKTGVVAAAAGGPEASPAESLAPLEPSPAPVPEAAESPAVSPAPESSAAPVPETAESPAVSPAPNSSPAPADGTPADVTQEASATEAVPAPAAPVIGGNKRHRKLVL